MIWLFWCVPGDGEVLRAARGDRAVPRDGAAGLDARVGRAGRGAGLAGVAHARRAGAGRRARAVGAALGAAHPARRAAHRARRPARRAARQA